MRLKVKMTVAVELVFGQHPSSPPSWKVGLFERDGLVSIDAGRVALLSITHSNLLHVLAHLRPRLEAEMRMLCVEDSFG